MRPTAGTGWRCPAAPWRKCRAGQESSVAPWRKVDQVLADVEIGHRRPDHRHAQPNVSAGGPEVDITVGPDGLRRGDAFRRVDAVVLVEERKFQVLPCALDVRHHLFHGYKPTILHEV